MIDKSNGAATVFRNRDSLNSPWGKLENGACSQQWDGQTRARRGWRWSRRTHRRTRISEVFSERPKGCLPGHSLQVRRFQTKWWVYVSQRSYTSWLKKREQERRGKDVKFQWEHCICPNAFSTIPVIFIFGSSGTDLVFECGINF